MTLQRLDIRTARYDRFSGSVAFDARRDVVEITHDALEELCGRGLTTAEAVDFAVSEVKMLAVLAGRVPADDGRIRITRGLVVDLPTDAPHDGDDEGV